MSVRLAAALDGNTQARSQLLADLKRYLDFVANRQFDQNLQAKMGPSDIVQQSMIQAVENLDQFQGKTMDEFRGWLRQILVNEARQMKRDLRAQKRDVHRERRLTDSQSHGFQGYLVDGYADAGNQRLQRRTGSRDSDRARPPVGRGSPNYPMAKLGRDGLRGNCRTPGYLTQYGVAKMVSGA